MSLPGMLDLKKADFHLMSDTMLNYCTQLSNAVGEAARQVREAWGIKHEGGHDMRAKMGTSLSSFAHKEVSSKSSGNIMMDTCHSLQGCPF